MQFLPRGSSFHGERAKDRQYHTWTSLPPCIEIRDYVWHMMHKAPPRSRRSPGIWSRSARSPTRVSDECPILSDLLLPYDSELCGFRVNVKSGAREDFFFTGGPLRGSLTDR
jgi:hypothetical protein